ncbi:hypothetical protein F7725_018534 [Dissostichus mawsoni]|uniref:AXH domain-containing protein n=1 Tax=Dissostichus mawsoni TaxID=36200 RepID=A0A7J5XTB0_DISMA|nr:hypothetical protein F7725_018534 [Dissostichus mawsoni]
MEDSRPPWFCVAQPNHEQTVTVAQIRSPSSRLRKRHHLGKPVVQIFFLHLPLFLRFVAPHTAFQTTLPQGCSQSLLLHTATYHGYITSANQHGVSYHAALPQHLVIPSGQSLLIPVSGTNNGTEMEVSRTVTATTTPQISTAMPHAYLATALSKCEALGPDGNQQPLLSLRHRRCQSCPQTRSRGGVNALPDPCSRPQSHPCFHPSLPLRLPSFFPCCASSILHARLHHPAGRWELKRVEDLKTEDFIQSAEISSELKIDSSTVERIDNGQSPNAVVIQFSVGELKAQLTVFVVYLQVCVEVLLEYPFFVAGPPAAQTGPPSCFELSCAKLCVGDDHLTNGGPGFGHQAEDRAPLRVLSQCGGHCKKQYESKRSGQKQWPPHEGFQCRQAGEGAGARTRGGGLRSGTNAGSLWEWRRETGISENDTPALTKTQCGEQERPTSRKRRWSAPERDQTERAEEEPPLTLPKPSFIPHEVKISIEGHSSTGIERRLSKE